MHVGTPRALSPDTGRTPGTPGARLGGHCTQSQPGLEASASRCLLGLCDGMESVDFRRGHQAEGPQDAYKDTRPPAAGCPRAAHALAVLPPGRPQNRLWVQAQLSPQGWPDRWLDIRLTRPPPSAGRRGGRETGRPDPTTAGTARLLPGPGGGSGAGAAASRRTTCLGPRAAGPPTAQWPRVCMFPLHVPLQSRAHTSASSSPPRGWGPLATGRGGPTDLAPHGGP